MHFIVAAASLAAAAARPPCHVHAPSGVTLATAPEGMQCSAPRVLDASAGEVSLAYKTTGGRNFTVTVFIYRKGAPHSLPDETAAQHMERVRGEVARRYSELDCQAWEPAGRSAMLGVRCHGHYNELGPDKLVTFIGIESRGAWWLKIRATAPAFDREASQQDLDAVVRSVTAD